jgi:tetratricopeptide (TPR) repeat protein
MHRAFGTRSANRGAIRAPDRERLSVARTKIYDNGQTRIYFHPNPSRRSGVLVITFDAMYVTDDPATFGFGEDFLLAEGYDVLAVRKTLDNWYQDLSLCDLAAAVAALPSQYERIFTYGSSMGAYAAVYFAGAVNARIIALSPLSSIDPAYKTYITNKDTQRHSVAVRHLRLRETLARTTGPHLVLYDPVRPFDRIYVEQEIAPNLPAGSAVVRQRHFGHPAIAVLSQMRVLKQTVTGFIEHGRVPPERWGLARRQSARFLDNFAAFLKERGRKKAALWALEQAITLKPKEAPLRIKYAEVLGGFGRHEQAVAQVQEAISMAPGNAGFHSTLASHLTQAGRHSDALEAVERAIALSSDNPRFRHQRAKVFARLGRAECIIESEPAVKVK